MTAEELKAACDAVIADPALLPVKDAAGKIIETHCNFGAQKIARAGGCTELDGLNADQIHAMMELNASGRWVKVGGSQATQHALSGGLGFAIATSKMLEEQHGHVDAVYPAPMQFSGSLQTYVPIVANIGVTDVEEKESQAFPVAKGEPDYFIWS